MLQGVRWVLFDAVGTLIYPEPPVAQVYHAAGQRFGSASTEEQIGLQFRKALAADFAAGSGLARPPTSEDGEAARWRRIVAAVFPDVSSPTAGDLFDFLWNHFAQAKHWRVFPDVRPALAALAARGLKLGIASNFDDRLGKIARGLPELAPCARVFVSSQIGFSKPDPRYFRAVAAGLATAPTEILFVGDDWTADIEGAVAAGWQSLWLCRDGAAGGRQAISSLIDLTRLVGHRDS
jgi:putative hydrolase of the HAD superfamily